MGSRHLDFKKSFQISIQPLLTAVSKEDLHGEFAICTNIEKENLYRLFIQVTKLLHENIAEQFESRCQETQVSSTFDKVELLVEEQTLDTLPADDACIKDVKEKLSTLKMDEIQYLKSLLQQVEEQNSGMESQIQSLKQNMGLSNAMNAVEKLRSWNSHLFRAPYG
ncbi:hypothetical protein KSP39_PZI012472 [Platanthera zijinensis]|uniref:Uncharacterized protein n=1 Tax=Platanthera zijinensis TaxID=2320716 RepID=A0AAP0BF09_9ASPA